MLTVDKVIILNQSHCCFNLHCVLGL